MTRQVFDEVEGWINFEKEIKKMYGERDEEKAAEDRLNRLTQTSSVSALLSAFNRDRFRVNWDESALKDQFYRKLKPTVKDELCKMDRYSMTFDTYAAEAVKIDNRLYEREMEDKGRYYTKGPKPNQGKKVQHKSTSYGHHPGPMDIGAAQYGKTPQYTDKPKDKSKIKCFNCDKMGHYQRECRSPKKFQPVPEAKSIRVAETDRIVRMSEIMDEDPVGDAPYNDFLDFGHDSEPSDTLYESHSDSLQGLDNEEEPRSWFGRLMEEALMENIMPHMPEGTTPEQVRSAMEYGLAPLEEEDQDERTEEVPTPEVQVAEDRLQEEGTVPPVEVQVAEDRLQQEEEDWWIRLDERDHEVLRYGRPARLWAGLQIQWAGVQLPELMEGDIPLCHPDHPGHARMAWFDCVYDQCSTHIRYKIYHEVFPIRMDEEPILQVHEYGDCEDWDIQTKDTYNKDVVRIYAEITTPNECWYIGQANVLSCSRAWCNFHMRIKARDWQIANRDQKRVEELRASREWHRLDLPRNVYGYYGTLEDTARFAKGDTREKLLQREYERRHKMYPLALNNHLSALDAANMSEEYQQRQLAWEQRISLRSSRASKGKHVKFVPRLGKGQGPSPGPSGTN
jgi:hypothetical protein